MGTQLYKLLPFHFALSICLLEREIYGKRYIVDMIRLCVLAWAGVSRGQGEALRVRTAVSPKPACPSSPHLQRGVAPGGGTLCHQHAMQPLHHHLCAGAFFRVQPRALLHQLSRLLWRG